MIVNSLCCTGTDFRPEKLKNKIAIRPVGAGCEFFSVPTPRARASLDFGSQFSLLYVLVHGNFRAIFRVTPQYTDCDHVKTREKYGKPVDFHVMPQYTDCDRVKHPPKMRFHFASFFFGGGMFGPGYALRAAQRAVCLPPVRARHSAI